jgi:hypothetical protein
VRLRAIAQELTMNALEISDKLATPVLIEMYSILRQQAHSLEWIGTPDDALRLLAKTRPVVRSGPDPHRIRMAGKRSLREEKPKNRTEFFNQQARKHICHA